MYFRPKSLKHSKLSRLRLEAVLLIPILGGSEAGSYLRLIDSCITQLKAQGPSGTCNEKKEEEEGSATAPPPPPCAPRCLSLSPLSLSLLRGYRGLMQVGSLLLPLSGGPTILMLTRWLRGTNSSTYKFVNIQIRHLTNSSTYKFVNGVIDGPRGTQCSFEQPPECCPPPHPAFQSAKPHGQRFSLLNPGFRV